MLITGDASHSEGPDGAFDPSDPSAPLRLHGAAPAVIARHQDDLASDGPVEEPDDHPFLPVTAQATPTTTRIAPSSKPVSASGVGAAASRICWVAAVLCLFGVGDAQATEASPSGVAGTITLAPSCGGPQREGADCRVPYADVQIRLVGMNGAVLALTRTSASGQYRMPAPAGRHRVQVMPPIRLIRCTRAEAVVEDAGYTVVDIECDSGMR